MWYIADSKGTILAASPKKFSDEAIETDREIVYDNKHILRFRDEVSEAEIEAWQQQKELAEIRQRRALECFPIINRGMLWYNKLTDKQKTELAAWYEAWLDAPETGTAPTAPVWLNEVAGQAKTI